MEIFRPCGGPGKVVVGVVDSAATGCELGGNRAELRLMRQRGRERPGDGV